MQQQLLWIEIVSKLAPGLLLLIMPRMLAKAAGLPVGEDAFWPRLVGAGLTSLVAATFVEGQLAPGRGLGIMGSVAINLTLAAILGGLLILGRATATRRGRLLLWLVCGLLTMLALVEIVSTR